MKLLVGLGNPGKEYATTRHNVGFLFVDFFRKQRDFPEFEDTPKFRWMTSMGSIEGEKVIILKPLTYMNVSGESVATVAHFYKLDPARDILVVSDDVDMEFWKVRSREKGSSGGQNGLKSIAQHLGTEEFARIKIGIGRDDRFHLADWVLSQFQAKELQDLQTEVFPKAMEKAVERICV